MAAYIFHFLYEDEGGLREIGTVSDEQVLGPDGKLKIPKIYEKVLLDFGGRKKRFMIKSKQTSYNIANGGDVHINFVVTDIEEIAVTNITKTWDDLEKKIPNSLPIKLTGTSPSIQKMQAELPAAGSTEIVKRKWLDKVMDKTAAEGYELNGYTVSILPPGFQIHYKKKPPQE